MPKKKSVSGPLHLRRCHVCSHLSETNSGRVVSCDGCGRMLAPFFFFEESEAEIFTENQPRPLPRSGERMPVIGFTVFW